MNNGIYNQISLLYYIVYNKVYVRFLLSHVKRVCKNKKYCNRMSGKKILSFWWMFMFMKKKILSFSWMFLYVLEDKTSKKKKNSVCLSVCLLVCTWTFAVDTITFEGVSGTKQNLVCVFYVWNVGLILKSKVKSWFWSWSWSWTGFWFLQKLCGTTPNLVGIFRTKSITFQMILILKSWSWSWKKNLKKCCGTKLNFMSIINM